MTKAELIKNIATKTGYTQKDIKSVLDVVKDIVYETMAKEEKVTIFDGLSLIGTKQEECVRRNPATGENVTVPTKIVPRVKFGVEAKRCVNAAYGV